MNTGPVARHADPDFAPSLRLLVERERYSLHDIGLMFDVSRERVRQWCVRYEIVHPDRRGRRGLMVTRVWDDTANRFTPVINSIQRATRRRLEAERRQQRREDALTARRARTIAKIIALREALGREPSVKEMAETISGRVLHKNQVGSVITRAWGSWGSVKYGRAMKAIREATGCQPRPRGSPGHIQTREPPCKR